MNPIKDKCFAIINEIELSPQLNHADQEQINRGKNAGLENYLELRHENQVAQLADFYAVVDRIKIKRAAGFTCPVKTVALFAHNQEFSVLPDELPALVRVVAEGCRSRQDVDMLIRDGTLPKTFHTKNLQPGAVVPIADIVCFDTQAQ